MGEEEAALCYRKLLAITHQESKNIDADKWLWYGDFVNTIDLWEEGDFVKKLQQGDGLGKRMTNAFQEAFAAGFKKTVIIGSDCPEINSELVNEAFHHLEHADVVIGPATDGGYYLLGMRSFHNLFEGINWSTGEVYASTIQKVQAAGLTFEKLTELTDIDTVEDLKKFSQL